MNWRGASLKDYILYVVLDRKAERGRGHIYVAREAVAGGADIIQLRDKEISARELLGAAKSIREITRDRGALFIVNDRPDVALECDADGVHLGQDDLPVACARKILGKDKIIGKSTHSLGQALEAQEEGADYVSVGPVFATPTKPDYPEVGLGLISEAKGKLGIPFVAIGGIGEENIRKVLARGATRVAVVRAVVAQEDVAGAARKLKDIINDTVRVR